MERQVKCIVFSSNERCHWSSFKKKKKEIFIKHVCCIMLMGECYMLLLSRRRTYIWHRPGMVSTTIQGPTVLVGIRHFSSVPPSSPSYLKETSGYRSPLKKDWIIIQQNDDIKKLYYTLCLREFRAVSVYLRPACIFLHIMRLDPLN